MPPWHADAQRGTFHNERYLTDTERQTLVAWANGGAPRGDATDLPAAPGFVDGWAVGKPDLIFEMPEEYRLPADGTIAYEYFYMPTNFTEPRWVTGIEIRPGNREVVHHALLYHRTKAEDAPVSKVLLRNPAHSKAPESATGTRPPRDDIRQQLPALNLIATYAPGTTPQVAPAGTAFRLDPGGVLILQMHYTTTGDATTDRSRVGFVLSRDPSPREIRASHFMNYALVLPPGAADVAVSTDVEFLADTTVWGLLPHTHLRGKKWDYQLLLPGGERRTILSIPRYDFNWQTYYMFREPLLIPKGSKIIATAWYDNSAANKSNPDPKAEVRWGDQTWEEMQYTGILFSLADRSGSTTASTGGR
jgi:hypothetical protein